MKFFIFWYSRFTVLLNHLQSPLLLVIRLYFGYDIMTNGWGKLNNAAGFAGNLAGWGIPFPHFNAYFVSGLEFIGGVCLILGLGSRLSAMLLAGDMLVAYWTADRAAFKSFFTDSDKFTGAAPYTLLSACLVILAFGAGLYSLDTLIERRFKGPTV